MNSLLFLGLPGGGEWFVILVVALLLFGKRLPEVAHSMGESITEFKRGLHRINDEAQRTSHQTDDSEIMDEAVNKVDGCQKEESKK